MSARAALVVLAASLAAPRIASARSASVPTSETDARGEASPPPPAVAPPAAPVAGPRPDLRPRLYVEDEDQLPRLMQKDPEFAQRAQSLVQRRTASWVVFGLGMAASFALVVAAANHMNGPPPGDPNFGQAPDGSKYALAGLASLGIGTLVAMAVYPRHGEVVDLVNGWNLAHPDEPLEVQPLISAPTQRDAQDLQATMTSPVPTVGAGVRLVVPSTGGPPVPAIPVGGDMYVPVTGGPPVTGVPVD
jgi:hypothetical protein